MSQGRLPVNVGGNPYSNAIMMGYAQASAVSSSNEPDNLYGLG